MQLRRAVIRSGLLVWAAGTFLLLVNSDITDLALALISVGGVMTIWFKLGVLEASTKSLENRFEKLERCMDDVKVNIHQLSHRVSRAEDKLSTL